MRDDDEQSGGRIRSLSDRLRDEYGLLSGSELELFIDRDIKWGEEWASRIAEALQQTTFLIPIITPRFFRSEACRKELLEFVAEARSLGVEQLLLPIYYVPVPELEVDDPTDEVMAVVKRTEWQDLRSVRLLDEQDAAHRAKVAELAERLIEISDAVTAQPGSVAVTKTSADSGATAQQSDIPEESTFLLDDIAASEAALPRISANLEGLSRSLEALAELAERYTPQMAAAETFAERLVVANKLARDLDDPASEIETQAAQYAALMSEVDPGVVAMIRLAGDRPVTEHEDVAAFAESIRGLATASRTNGSQLDELGTVLDETSKFSRELQRPLKRIRVAIRNVADANTIIERWEARIDELNLLSTP